MVLIGAFVVVSVSGRAFSEKQHKFDDMSKKHDDDPISRIKNYIAHLKVADEDSNCHDEEWATMDGCQTDICRKMVAEYIAKHDKDEITGSSGRMG